MKSTLEFTGSEEYTRIDWEWRVNKNWLGVKSKLELTGSEEYTRIDWE